MHIKRIISHRNKIRNHFTSLIIAQTHTHTCFRLPDIVTSLRTHLCNPIKRKIPPRAAFTIIGPISVLLYTININRNHDARMHSHLRLFRYRI